MTDKKDDALKLALEALEYISSHYMSLPKIGCMALAVVEEALAEPAQQQEPIRVPVTDNTYGYAKSLAEAIFKQHFASDEHYASGRMVWGVNDTVIGILTQIDNMVADMVRRPAQQQEPEKDWGAIGQAHLVALKKSSRELVEEAAVRVVHKMAQQQEPVAWMKDCADFWEHYTYISEASQENYKAEAQMWVEKLRKSPQPSKPWVGLTDEERDAILNREFKQWWSRHDAVCRAIEAKLREKNT